MVRGSPFGNELVVRNDVAQRVFSGFGDADARRDLDAMRPNAIVRNEEIGLWARQVFFVVAFASDAEGLGQASGAAGQLAQVAGCAVEILRERHVPRFRHLLDSGNRFERAEQDSARFSIGEARDVEEVVIAIDKVNVGKARWAEENEVPGRASTGGMSSRIMLAEIGLDFDDPGGQEFSSVAPHQDFPQQVTADFAGIA